jgi:hypothetical protein
MVEVYATGEYTMSEIGNVFDLHNPTVNRMVAKCKACPAGLLNRTGMSFILPKLKINTDIHFVRISKYVYYLGLMNLYTDTR